ncbi:MAG: hypothetical protein M0P74_16910 [Syntrophales bacterium]|nr:hypothetical protein [Syntrophales bacterium]
MIVEVACDVKQINAKDQGRGYDWPRPERCPRCLGGKIWGHGFVWAFLGSLKTGVYLKRYRCPVCGCVMRMKPSGYFPRFSVTVEKIKFSLTSKLEGGSWFKGLAVNRQRHWLRSLMRQVTVRLGVDWLNRLLDGFAVLTGKGKVPVSRSFKT